jgi:PAS domain S-box-containing protein
MAEKIEQENVVVVEQNLDDEMENGLETAVFDTVIADRQDKFRSLFEATPISLWEEDFSEVKKYIDQLKDEGVQEFKEYFDAHPEAVNHCIGLVKVIDVNQQTLQLYKAETKEELLNNLDKIFGTESFDIFKEELIFISQGKTIFESEGINYTLKGEPINVAIRWSVVPGYEDTLSQVIVSSVDMTQIKRSSDQLRLQATALESAANAIVISDEKGDILWVNPAFTKLTGYSYNEVLGKNPRILKSGKNSDAFYNDLWRTVKAGAVWHGEELINKRKDGTFYHEKMTIAPVKDENGRVSRFVAIKEDITERKLLEMKLRRQLKEEEILREIVSLTSSKEDIASIVSVICRKLAQFFDVPSCTFALLSEKEMIADVIAEYHQPEIQDADINLIPLINILPLDFVMAQNSILTINDIHASPLLEPVKDIIQDLDNVSSCMFPVKVENEIRGILEFATLAPKEYSPENISFVNQVASLINQTLLRIQVEEELNRQQKFAQQVMNNMGQGLVVCNTDWIIEYCNPKFAELLGYEPQELPGKSALSFVYKLDSSQVDVVQQTWLRGDVQSRSLPLQRKDGSPIHVLMTAVPRLTYNKITGAISVVTDLTEQKQMEKHLRRQLQEEELLHRLASLTSSKKDLIEILTDACAELAQFFKLPKAAFALMDEDRTQSRVITEYCELGQPSSLGTIIPFENNPSLQYLVREKKPLAIVDAQHDEILAPAHDVMKRLNIASILLVPILIGDEFAGSIGFDSPIKREFTEKDIILGQKVAHQLGRVLERQQADEALQRERDFAHQIMSNMGQGLLVLTKERTIRYCNPMFMEMVGYSDAELMGKPIWQLLSSETNYDAIQPVQDELNSNKLVREVVLKHADGDNVHVLLTAVPPKGRIETDGAIVVVTDLSQQKEIEQALSDARDQAVEASRLKSEFLANMSHEIRTPLNAVIGMTSLMLDSSLTSEQVEFAETIRSSGEVLLSLINDILDFSKIEAGKLELEERPFTVRDCMEEALDVVVTKASGKGLELAYMIDDIVPRDVIGDVTRVRQVLVNLLNNAIKFTDAGEVVLSVGCKRVRHDDVSQKMLHFSVKDTGIGIPEHRLDRLFKSFSQVDASTTRRFGGTGLGLAISKQLVEMMGGQIWVESEEGNGSTFHFTISAKTVPVSRHVFKQKVQSELSGKRLLIVDDNATNRKILVKQATLWGMAPQAVESGLAALKLLKADAPFDCAILDMQMPEMDGIMLASEIRKLDNGNSLPLIMLSSIGDRDEFKESSYFAAFLTKPIKQQLLFETLNGVLSETAVIRSSAPKKLQIDPEMGKKHPLRVLLAEDNLVNQKVASRILERMGYRADIAADGLEVLEALQRQPYDVVLMDVQMPNMDGVEATIQIRDIWPPAQQPTVVAMTAHALTGDREKYLDAGMDHYISKPVRIQELLKVLAECQPLGK